MPDNVQEYLWWALNGAILIVAFFIRAELSEIKKEMRDARTSRDNHEVRITRLEVRCNIQHGDDNHPMRRAEDFA